MHALILAACVLWAPASAWGATQVTTFTTVGEHAYTVPAGVTRVDVVAVGGEGAATTAGTGRVGGLGAMVSATLTVTPGETLYAEVGSSASGTTAGANGGGTAGGTSAQCDTAPGAGGGASDVRTVPVGQPGSDASRVLVAGGGGGAGSLGTSSTDVSDLYGGNRGRGGGSALGGEGGFEGDPGYGGAGGATGGTSASGGDGGVGVAGAGSGCGGGGGGGDGGGGAGAAGGAGASGGGGGGGGSLAPQDGAIGIVDFADPTSVPPSVQFTTPGTPAASGPLSITSFLSLKQNDQVGLGACDFCNCPSSCIWGDTRTGPRAPDDQSLDVGYDSVQAWGAGALKDGNFTSALAGVRRGPDGSPAAPGAPFFLADFEHINYPIRGDSPTLLNIQTRVTVQPPVGAPAVFTFGGPTDIQLDFLETANTPPCDPSIQQSPVPCDDLWTLGNVTSTVTADGVTWHFQLLGWQTAPGTFATRLVADEDAVTTSPLYAVVSVDTNATTSTLAVADGATPAAPTLQLTTTPVPQTGGTVTFTDAGSPIAGCADLPVGTSNGTTTCSPTGLSAGAHTFAATFAGGVGYSASTAGPQTYTVAAAGDAGTSGPGTGGSGAGGTPPGLGGGLGTPGGHPVPYGIAGVGPALPTVAFTGRSLLRTTRSGIATASLTCAGYGVCTGRAILRITRGGARAAASKSKSKSKSIVIASVRYSITAGKAKRIELKLTRMGRRLLQQAHGKLRVTLILKPVTGAGASRKVTLRERKRRRHATTRPRR